MNKEELIEKAQELTIKNVTDGKSKYYSWGFHKGCVVGLEYNNKHIAELEEKISILLSCKNCPENKGGLLCQKEYEDKCLAQKIQFIKELQEEIKNLEKTYRKQRNKRIDELQKENAKLKTDYEVLSCSVGDFGELQNKLEEEQRKNNGLSDNLTKANELLKQWLQTSKNNSCNNINIVADTEQLLKEIKENE